MSQKGKKKNPLEISNLQIGFLFYFSEVMKLTQ